MSAFPKTQAALGRLRSTLTEVDVVKSCARIIVAPIAWPLMFVGAIGVALWFAVDGDCSPIAMRRKQR